jgi:hypothetical protein
MSLTIIDETPAARAAATDPLDFVGEKEAARSLKLSVRKMQRWRETGGGPVYHKFGQAVRYTRGDLMTWAAAQRRHSTAEPVPAPAIAAEQPVKRKRGWPKGRKRGPRKAPATTSAAAE